MVDQHFCDYCDKSQATTSRGVSKMSRSTRVPAAELPLSTAPEVSPARSRPSSGVIRGLLPMFWVLLAGGLSACAVGPDFKRPVTSATDRYTETALAVPADGRTQFVMGRDIPFAWWEAMGSPALNRWVERALTANPNISAAEAGLRQAEAYAKAQGGYFYPTVGVGLSGQRQRWANDSGQTPGLYNLYTAQASISYTPDVFGANRRTVEALAAASEVALFQREATYVSLVDNVVATVVQVASLHDQLAAAREVVMANQRAVDIRREQARVGHVMDMDLAAQEQALAQAIAVAAPLEAQYNQSRDLLRALCGVLPTDPLDDMISLADLHLPAELPLSLPSALVEKRPDVRAAEAVMHAASARVGIAMAARLPQFTITAARGGLSEEFGHLFSAGGPFWGVTGSVTQTLFSGGTLLHEQRAAEQGLIQAEAQYRSTVIGAFQNVADILFSIEADARALAANTAGEEAAKRILDLTNAQHRLGYVDELTLLTARIGYQQARIVRLQAETNRYGDVAALIQALGGGWWNRR